MDSLLHPNLLSTTELLIIIKERQLNIKNLNELTRNELIDLYKAHVMPKPQRQRHSKVTESQDKSTSNSLAQEVKRIKLNHQPVNSSSTPNNHIPIQRVEMVANQNYNKRSITENETSKPKRQRIQWP